MGGWFCASVAAENERWSRWLGGRVRCPKSAALSVQRAGQGGSAELESVWVWRFEKGGQTGREEPSERASSKRKRS